MTEKRTVRFKGAAGNTLGGLLELPDAAPIATALLAHCFTCGKDLIGASRISRTLAQRGYAVLRFDFTGLGDSEGDFGTAGFASNIDDLLAAAVWLEQDYTSPALLVGHSLGGTAVLHAAARLPTCKAVVSIGAPADAEHVLQSFHCDAEQLSREGEASVTLAGREFTISKAFIDDLREHAHERIGRLHQAVLVMHAPFDRQVPIAEAERIFKAARHPKSFVSLDNADHLLSDAADAHYAASVIAAWASRFLGELAIEHPDVPKGEVRIDERDHRFALDVFSDTHHWLADEPRAVGGSDIGPDPYEHLLTALGSCTVMTIRMVAERKGWPLDDVRIRLSHSREHSSDCEGCEEKPRQLDVLTREIELIGDLSVEQHAKLMEIADKCPVHRTLTGAIEVHTQALAHAASP